MAVDSYGEHYRGEHLKSALGEIKALKEENRKLRDALIKISLGGLYIDQAMAIAEEALQQK